jgi:segregation and condensation protein A
LEHITYKLETFEGPLELLLFLINKNKVSIYDIPIVLILDQYMAYLDELRGFDIEIASEFVDMASQLVFIKSRMLLPRYEDEEEDPRAELVGALLEYQVFKQIGELLKQRSEAGFNTFVKQPEPLPSQREYLTEHSTDQLLGAISMMLENKIRNLPPPAEAFEGIVGREPVPVSSKIELIIGRLVKQSSFTLRSLYDTIKTRSDVVALFLAILELCKDNRILLEEKEDTYHIAIRQ